MGDKDHSEDFHPKCKKTKANLSEERSSRSSSKVIDWSLCLFCQKVKRKGVKTLLNVASFEAGYAIVNAARTRCDHVMLLNIEGVDLIASEAKYHSACRANYVSKTNLKYVSYKEESEEDECIYSAAFDTYIKEIALGLSKGKIFDMNFLLDGYKEALKLKGCTSSSIYRSSKLKKRMLSHFTDKIIFQKRLDPSKSELVYSSDLSVESIVETTASSVAEGYCQENRQDKEKDNKAILFHAAQIIKNDIKNCAGISIKPLRSDDISMENAKRLVPDSLKSFLSEVISRSEKKSSLYSEGSTSDTEKDKRVVMLGQDIIHAASNSQVKTPKHIGLAVTVHHLTGSKELVTLLNRMGHCSSYDDVEVVNTAWAREISARSAIMGVVIPSNITPGSFIQFAADNNDFTEETLDGKQTTHSTTIVVYQREQYGPKPPPKNYADHSSRRRSLDQTVQSQVIHECSVRGKRPTVTSYTGKAEESYFVSEDPNMNVDIKELAWFLLRLNRRDVLQSNEDTEEQDVPGWSAFNAEMSSVVIPRTVVGYCPMIAGSPTEYSTIYTVLKTVQEMSSQLGQTNSVVTFDLAIYTKAKEIQWRYPEEFQKLFIRLGGFHIAVNFLALIGKMFRESGIEDVLVESGVYGPSSTQAILQGKAYNRGVRAHKLLMEALMRLQWDAFSSWVKEATSNEEDGKDNDEEELNVDLVNSVVQSYRSAVTQEQRREAYLVLCNTTVYVNTLFSSFKLETSSQMFKFWDDYVAMVLLLLKFIRAEREGDWNLHLEATTEMIPHFFAMDRINYSRWLPVYIMDMQQLAEKAPNVHTEFIKGNHAISRSSQPFNQVWTDMALEQSVNRDSKAIGGIIGITQRPGALEKWFLTAHERASATSATKAMLYRENGSTTSVKHKESSKPRVRRDEEDIQKLMTTITTAMSDPFQAHKEIIPVSNLATGVVLPAESSGQLLKAKELGEEKMRVFVNKRIHTNEVGFWEPLPKMNIKTFASLSKKAKAKSTDEKLVTVSADRNLFGRLLIVSRARDVNLREVLKYELSSVPCSLAYTDGSLRKTNKSVLLKVLEEQVQVLPRLPIEEDQSTAYILDGMAVVQMLNSKGSTTFGELAKKYFDVISAQLGKKGCSRIDVVFDRYDKQESIKEAERARRGSSSSFEVRISGPTTPLPKKWLNYISNPINKTNLKIFLGSMWKDMAKAKLKPDEKLVLAGCFQDNNTSILITRDGELPLHHMVSDHEEADTRMILHAHDCASNYNRIVVQSPDTDVIVLCVYAFHDIHCQQLWFRTGVKDKVRLIPIHYLVRSLEQDACRLLPAFHALTGCDTTSGLFQIGKRKAWKALMKNKSIYEDLGRLGNTVCHYENTGSTNCLYSDDIISNFYF